MMLSRLDGYCVNVCVCVYNSQHPNAINIHITSCLLPDERAVLQQKLNGMEDIPWHVGAWDSQDGEE